MKRRRKMKLKEDLRRVVDKRKGGRENRGKERKRREMRTWMREERGEGG